jgi:NAD(P)-dependent dehydrogenase (short-subunit alcohol dehydrogenase family)
MGRFGEADEVVEAAIWLLSDAASFTTGATLSVDDNFLA